MVNVLEYFIYYNAKPGADGHGTPAYLAASVIIKAEYWYTFLQIVDIVFATLSIIPSIVWWSNLVVFF